MRKCILKDYQVVFLIIQGGNMSELDAEICSLLQETQAFIKEQARNQASRGLTLCLRTEYKTNLKLTDSDKNVFEVDQSFLSAFRDTYTDKSYKAVRLNNWELQLKFVGKRCAKIDLICESVTFLATKTIKREIKGCHFKISIIHNETELKKLSPQTHGYLNRLGKRNIVAHSENQNKQMNSLLSFANKKSTKIQAFNYKPWSKNINQINPLSVINQDGKKVLERLRHFITKQQIQDFMVQKQVSEQSVFELNRLLSKPL